MHDAGVGMVCPDEAKLDELLTRVLPATEAARIEAHLADCDDCRNLVFALASTGGDAAGDEPTVERIGRFELVDTIGRGAMGIVYRARDPELDRMVAIKVRRSQAKLDVDAEDRLQREAKALARLSHPNVVAVYEAGRVAGMTFVAMEYVDGVTLDAWLATRRTPDEVLALFAGAGRGLAAAHAAGLVHRDFKPHNVFVGDGIAKVGDFGLVRAEPSGALPAALTMTLSVSGAIIGTPAYMSPEQLRGEPATEQSDQFSFCVTLFEALHGARPFAGGTIDALLAAMGAPLALPVSLPSRVKRVLRRGLALDPEARFASITELLEVLTRRPLAKRWIAAGVIAVAGAATAGALLLAGADSDPCATPDVRAREVFGPARTQRIESAFAATKAPGAEDVGRRVGALFGQYGQRWHAASNHVCRATTEGRQSTQLADRQRACLERRLEHADALASLLERVQNSDAVRGAASAVLLVPDAGACTSADLGDREPPPADKFAEVRRLESELDRLNSLFQLGQTKAAVADIDAVVQATRATGYSALVARALIAQAVLYAATDQFDKVESLLDEAAREAAIARDDRLAAEAWTRRVYAVGVHASRYDDAQQWARAAEAAVLRAGNPPDLRAALHLNVSTLLIETDKLAEGERELLAALELRTKRLPHDAIRIGDIHNNLAALYQRQAKMELAEQHFTKAVELYRSVHGEEHPDVIETYINLGFYFSERELPERALAALEKALALGEKVLGPDHVNVGITLDTMGLAQVSLGHYAEAATLHRRAYEIMLAKVGPKHRRTAFALANMARAAQRLGDYATAIPAYRDAATILAEAIGPDHDLVARTLVGLGTVYRLSGDAQGAEREYKRALAMFEAKQSPEAVIAQFNLAQMALERGDCKAARKGLEAATTAFGKLGGDPMTLTAYAGVVYCDAVEKQVHAKRVAELEAAVAAAPLATFEPHVAAFIHFTLARTAAHKGEKARARELATRARDLFATVKLVQSQQSVEAFLNEELR